MTATSRKATAHDLEIFGRDEDTQTWGEIISWDFSKKVFSKKVSREALLDSCEYFAMGHGLNASTYKKMVPEHSVKHIFNRVKAKLSAQYSIDPLKELECYCPACNTTQNHYRWQFTAKDKTDPDLVLFDFSGKVSACPKCFYVSGSGATDSSLNDQVQVEKRLLTGSDVSRFALNALRESITLYPINLAKGVDYFVFKEDLKHVDFVKRIVKSCGGTFHELPIHKGDASGDKSVAGIVEQTVEKMIADLEQNIEEWDESTRQSTVIKRAKAWKELEFKIESFADHFGEVSQRLTHQLNESKEKLLKKAEMLDK